MVGVVGVGPEGKRLLKFTCLRLCLHLLRWSIRYGSNNKPREGSLEESDGSTQARPTRTSGPIDEGRKNAGKRFDPARWWAADPEHPRFGDEAAGSIDPNNNNRIARKFQRGFLALAAAMQGRRPLGIDAMVRCESAGPGQSQEEGQAPTPARRPAPARRAPFGCVLERACNRFDNRRNIARIGTMSWAGANHSNNDTRVRMLVACFWLAFSGCCFLF